MFENKNLTEVSSLGEFGLIDHLTKNVKTYNSSTIKSIGDDSAVLSYDKKILISTDMLIEGVHFDLMYVPFKHLGYKAVMSNFSDICAMNGVPKQITVSIGISSKFSLEAIEELYSGMLLACNKYKVDIVGGDTCSSQKGLIISITVLGEANENDIVYRNGAKKGDLICVSGDLGAAYVGLQLLEREKSVFLAAPKSQPNLTGKDYILERQLKPEARMDIISLFNELKIKPSSMIDVSDGLASEILHLCKNSNVGCKLYEAKIPIDSVTYDTAREFNLDPTVCALSGGEDYELLFTIKQDDYNKIKSNPDISVIGYVTDASEGTYMISKSEHLHEIKAQGWNAFKKHE